MKIEKYNINLEKAIKLIKKKEYKIIGIQIPDGLKGYILKIVEYLETKISSKILIISDPCFGACDIANYELKNLGLEFIIHIGHMPLLKNEEILIPTIFINAHSILNIKNVVKKSIPLLEGKTIGVVTTAQHIENIENVLEILKDNNLNPIISKGDNRIFCDGQILGCNLSSGMKIKKDVDSYLFIGSGNFHPIGLLICSKKPVIAADPYTNSIKKEELYKLRDKILKQRYGLIASSLNSKKFGIIIGIKRGQQRMELANKIKKMIDSSKKKSFFIAIDVFSSSSMHGFRDIDCLVSTSCPRIAIDDFIQYKIPILTPIELEIVLGLRKWEDYVFDQI
jgi:2-(3-amino-3-carboxypropyl)histidine synthase